MNKLLLLLTVILGVVAIVDEMNLLKVKIPDTTKVLLLMCVLVLFLKTHKLEKVLLKQELIKEGANEGKKCGYAGLDLSKNEYDPNKLCNYTIPDTNNIPLKEKMVYQMPNSFKSAEFKPDGTNKASLDGSDELKNISNFTFTQNVSSPDCCPSIYSSSTGCVCNNQTQNQFIQSRGGNSSHLTEF